MQITFHPKVTIIVYALIITSACLAFVFSVRSGVQAAGTQISLSPEYGHPTASIHVNGNGFGINEIVSITFDAISIGTASTGGKANLARKWPFLTRLFQVII